jgi:hypothetical protein
MADPIDIQSTLDRHIDWLDVKPGGVRANLRGANLSGANLRGADLSDALLPIGYRIASLCFGGWPVMVTPEQTVIGCQQHPNSAWLSWEADAPEIAEMHEDAAAWWRRHREAVCAVIRDVRQEGSDG